MKKKFIGGFFLFGIFFILFFSCSEKKNPFDVPTHPEAWLNEESDQFHGNAVVENSPENCRSCHGVEYTGGTSDKSCFSCHELYPHAGWKTDAAHGASIIAKLYEIEDCKDCHGDDYGGGSSDVSCYT